MSAARRGGASSRSTVAHATSAPCSFNVIVGEPHFLDDKGNTVAVENWKTSVNRYLAYCNSEGITPNDITGFAG